MWHCVLVNRGPKAPEATGYLLLLLGDLVVGTRTRSVSVVFGCAFAYSADTRRPLIDERLITRVFVAMVVFLSALPFEEKQPITISVAPCSRSIAFDTLGLLLVG